MKPVYKSKESKAETLTLYESQMKKLNCSYQDIFIDTSFGKTHLIETGNFEGEPLLVFHGGNSTTAYNLLMCRFLLQDFHIYAVDIIGHPGKSAEVCLKAHGYSYGKWASEVIDGIGYTKIRCFGGSFGAGVLAKTMCVAPQKIEKCVLLVPSGIHNAIPVNSIRMCIPLLKYLRTRDEKYIVDTALFMSLTQDPLDEDTMDILKDSFDHVNTKVAMPSNVSAKYMKKCLAPTLVMAAEKDCMFPARKVLKRAQKIITKCSVYELKNRGHMHILTTKEKEMILRFLT